MGYEPEHNDRVITAALLAAYMAISQTPPPDSALFPDNEKNHWAFEGLAAAWKEGFLNDWPTEGKNNGFAYFVATHVPEAYAFCVHRMAQIELEFRERGIRISRESPVDPDDQRSVEALKEDLALYRDARAARDLALLDLALRQASKVLGGKLTKLGVSTADLNRAVPRFRSFLHDFQIPRPGLARTQFPDVPTDHWASKAVLELRRWGIIDGYPDEKFDR